MGKKKYYPMLETYQAKPTFDSGLCIISPVVTVERELLAVCKYIQGKLTGKEFSLLTKGSFGSENFNVSAQYVIPEQEISSGHVCFLEELESYRQDGFNTIIHSHHTMGIGFSGSDKDTINQNFLCSLLFANGEFKESSLLIPFQDKFIKFQSNKIEIIERIHFDESLLAKFHEPEKLVKPDIEVITSLELTHGYPIYGPYHNLFSKKK